MARKTRPFKFNPKPGPGKPIGACGIGRYKQIDIHFADTDDLSLLDIAKPTQKHLYAPELASLSRQLNTLFEKEGRACVEKVRREEQDNSIQLTMALVRGSLYLAYARPSTKRRRRTVRSG